MASEIEAVAKAAEEVAKTAGKAIDASGGLGKFLERVFGPAIEEYGGQLHDNRRYRRAANMLKLQQKWDRLRADHGITEQPRPLSLKFGTALLEAASVEEDDELQGLFANLLFNTTDSQSKAETRQAYVAMLQGMSGFDAKVLFAIDQSPDANPGLYPTRTVYTAKLPGDFVVATPGAGHVIELPPEPVLLSLNNLARLGCIVPAGVWDGAVSYGLVTFTPLGQAFVRACTVAEPGGQRGTETDPTSTEDQDGGLDLSVT